jgi:uncharacterized protein YggE
MDFQEIKDLKQGKKIILKILLAVLSVFLLVLAVSSAVGIVNKIKEGKYIGWEFETKNVITVSGEGEIYATPDLAIVDFSVVSDFKTVAEAMTDNTKKMNAVIDAAKKLGVKDEDLETTGFNISPRYEWYGPACLYPPCPSGRRVLAGYEVTQTLEVKIRDMAKIGDIIQGATDAGSNQAGDLQLTIDKQDEVLNQARQQAIAKAKTKADALAAQLGVKLVRIVNFSESGASRYFPTYMEAKGLGGGEAVAAPQIQTGQNKIVVDVSITYQID